MKKNLKKQILEAALIFLGKYVKSCHKIRKMYEQIREKLPQNVKQNIEKLPQNVMWDERWASGSAASAYKTVPPHLEKVSQLQNLN